jgi:hypothetical protein
MCSNIIPFHVSAWHHSKYSKKMWSYDLIKTNHEVAENIILVQQWLWFQQVCTNVYTEWASTIPFTMNLQFYVLSSLQITVSSVVVLAKSTVMVRFHVNHRPVTRLHHNCTYQSLCYLHDSYTFLISNDSKDVILYNLHTYWPVTVKMNMLYEFSLQWCTIRTINIYQLTRKSVIAGMATVIMPSDDKAVGWI